LDARSSGREDTLPDTITLTFRFFSRHHTKNSNGPATTKLGLKNVQLSQYCKTAVTQNGLALEYAPELLKADSEFVKSAVAQNGLALRYAKDYVRANKDSTHATWSNTVSDHFDVYM
jgi:hypothetical protein